MKSLSAALSTICLLLGGWNVRAQFVQTHGPQAGQATDILFAAKDTAYAATYQGVFKSTDNALTWKLAITGIGNYAVNCLAVHQGSLYAGTNNGVYMSNDHAQSWSLISSGIPANGGEVYALAFYGDTLICGGEKQVYFSDDNGQNWTFAGNGISPQRTVASLTVQGSQWFAAVSDSVYVSSNSGSWWTSSNSGLPAGMQSNSIGIKSISGNLVLRTMGYGAFVSTDNGGSWTLISDITDVYVSDLYADSNKIYASTLNGFFASQDGINWLTIAPNINGGPFSLAVKDSVVLAGIRGEGIYRSVNLGGSFQAQNTGFYATRNTLLLGDTVNVFAGTYDGLYLTTDHGNTYASANNGCTNPFGYNAPIKCLYRDNGNLFVGTDYGIYKSTTNGAQWQSINGNLPVYTEVNAILANGSTIFAGSRNTGIYLSSNNGASWTLLSNGAPNGCISLVQHHGKLFATFDRTYVSSDNGGSWSVLPNSPLNNYYQTISNGKQLFSANYLNVKISKNDGATWSSINAGPGMAGFHFISLVAIDTTYLLVGTLEGKVFLTADKGWGWMEVTTGLPYNAVVPYAIWSLGANYTDVYASVDGHGVWRRPFSEMNIIKNMAVPEIEGLSGVTLYPNPAVGYTSLSCFSAHSSAVQVTLTGINGNLVQKEAWALEEGRSELVLDTRTLAPGVYIVQITGEGYTLHRKLVVQN